MSPTRLLAGALAVAAVLAGRSVLAGEARADGSGPKAPPAVHLRVVATTTIEVALAWDAGPAATSYVLQRSTSPSFDPASTVAFELPPGVTGDMSVAIARATSRHAAMSFAVRSGFSLRDFHGAASSKKRLP